MARAAASTTRLVALDAEAFRAAADPAKFPGQIAEGLRAWQPKKFFTRGFGPGGPGGAGRAGGRWGIAGEGAPTLLQFAEAISSTRSLAGP